MRYFVLSGVLVPWLQVNASLASDLVETAGMEAEALDVDAVLLGDVALLVMAPLVIYAALKMIWEEQFEEDDADDAEKKDETPIHKKSTVLSASTSDLESSLSDSVFKEVATNAVRNIIRAARESADSCLFDASFEELAVKVGGRKKSLKWIESVVQKQGSLIGEDDFKAKVLESAEELSSDDLCLLLSKMKAEKAALQEIRKVIKLLIERHSP